MDSCFPPLAALSLRDSRKHNSITTGSTNRHSTHNSEYANTTSNPQIGKIEILQDLDLYYIRQIAHNLKEYDLEQKIELEIKMREGTARLLAACKHQSQTLEAAKSLMTSNERMSTYMAELHRRKRAPIPQDNKLNIPQSVAKVSLSELRMPLIWRDTDHFKNKGDYRRFAVFCLVKIGTEIYDTSLLCPVDRSLTDLTFSDALLFNQISANFECILEVYSHILQDDLSIASTPRKIKNTIHSSISRTVGKKLAASLKDELNSGKIGPNFELMASARLTLDDANDNIHTHDLIIANCENKSHQLPLFGHFCCRLAILPNCITKEICSGDLKVRNQREDNFNTYWGQLHTFKLNLWRKKEHWEKKIDPVLSVIINKESGIQLGKNNEIYISNLLENQNNVHIIRLKSKEEQQRWIKCIKEHIKDLIMWKHCAENPMQIMLPGNSKLIFNRQTRQGSLYDETPIIMGSVQTEHIKLFGNDTFALTPSTSLSSCASSSSSPTFRKRSLSSGGNNKPRSSNVLRTHWPFRKD